MDHYSTSLPSALDDGGMDDSSCSMFNNNKLADLEAQLNSIILGERPSTPETETAAPTSSSFGGSVASCMEEDRGSSTHVAAVASSNSATENKANKMRIKDNHRTLKEKTKSRTRTTARKKSSRCQIDKDGAIKREARALAHIGAERKPRTTPTLIRNASATSRNHHLEEEDLVVKRQLKAMTGASLYNDKTGHKNGKKGGKSTLFDPDPKYSEDHFFGNMHGALPVATFVIEEDASDGTFDGEVPRAEAIKPEKKTRFTKCCINSVLSVSLLIVAGVVACVMALVTVPSMQEDDAAATMGDPSNSTVAPTTYRESLGIQEQLEIVFGAEKFADEAKAHSKALDWLLHDDPMQLPPDAKNLMQRYVLAVFYFQTSVRGTWRSCNPPVIGSNETHECGFQLLKWSWPELVFDTVPSNRWLGKTHECEWAGITCVDDSIQYLILDAHHLSGPLPAELGLLPDLTYLSLVHNELTGELPVSLAMDWKHQARQVELQVNSFSGSIPKEWCQFTGVTRLNLAENLFTGSLPTEIGELGAGRTGDQDSTLGIFFNDNYLMEGPLPSQIGNLEELTFISMQRTPLTGQVPTEVGRLSMLQEFWVHETQLSGTIPSEMGILSSMRSIRMHHTGIGGTIPEELFNVPQLERLDLSHANLQGTISTKIGQLADSLTILRLENNTLTGDIPAELGHLTNIRTLYLQYNELEGNIPQPMCDTVLDRTNTTANDEMVRDIEADCVVSNDTNAPFVSCELGCCSVCCDSATQVCVGGSN